jgi:quinol monooxygenase YgiN
MTYIQTIEFTTTHISEIQDLMDEWLTKSQGRRTPHRATLVADQDRPNTYLQIVEFPSYEKAMQNNALPETAEFAEKATKLVDTGPVYRNLDVQRVDDLT